MKRMIACMMSVLLILCLCAGCAKKQDILGFGYYALLDQDAEKAPELLQALTGQEVETIDMGTGERFNYRSETTLEGIPFRVELWTDEYEEGGSAKIFEAAFLFWGSQEPPSEEQMQQFLKIYQQLVADFGSPVNFSSAEGGYVFKDMLDIFDEEERGNYLSASMGVYAYWPKVTINSGSSFFNETDGPLVKFLLSWDKEMGYYATIQMDSTAYYEVLRKQMDPEANSGLGMRGAFGDPSSEE